MPPNFANAFDLSSLAKPKVEVPAELPGIEVTAQNLQSEILAMSQSLPVVISFYSARHQDSMKALMTLAKLAHEDQAQWTLARVDIETQPQVAQAFQTKTLPYAVAVLKGQPIPLFENSYPEDQIRLVIDKLLTVAAQQGIGNAPEERMEPEEQVAIEALEKGDFDGAERAYRSLLARKPGDSFGTLGLAQVLLIKRTHGDDPQQVMAEAEKNPNNVSLQLRCADVEVVHGAIEPAFARLLRLLPMLNGEDKTLVKDRLIELFALVDPSDPILIKARAQLASALF